jgi:predicted porin
MNKKILAVAVAGAMTAPMAAQAVKYKLSGQVNRAVVFQDDGEQSAVRSVDAITSGTRFRLTGSEDIGNGMKVGFNYESQWSSSRSFTQRPDLNSDGSGGAGTLRQGNVWFSGNWGKLTLGQTDGAGNGATENDWVPSGSYHGRTSFTGGLLWRTSGGGTIGGGMTESSTFNEFDAFSRHDVIRYDSPKLGPVKLAASVGNDSVWELGAFVDSDIGGGNLLFSAFYGEDTQGVRSGGTDNRWGGSIRYLLLRAPRSPVPMLRTKALVVQMRTYSPLVSVIPGVTTRFPCITARPPT